LKNEFTRKVRELNNVEAKMNKEWSQNLSDLQRKLIDECADLSDKIGDGCPKKSAIYGYKPNGKPF